MKKFLLLSLMVVVLSGCSWFGNEDSNDSDGTSMFYDNGEIAVWYVDVDKSISLRLPDEMEGYEQVVTKVDEENLYGTVERVEFMIDGGSVAVLSVHERDAVEANLSTFAHAAASDDSEYLFSFATTLSGESELQSKLMDMSFNLGDYLTFE